MPKLTITEALAEIKTINARVAAKQKFIGTYLARSNNLKDPLEKDGGSPKLIRAEMDGIRDLMTNLVNIREAISDVNRTIKVTIDGDERTVSCWLIWRREVAPVMRNHYAQLSQQLSRLRDEARKTGKSVGESEAKAETDFVVNLNEKQLSINLEHIEKVLGTLDGQLSLVNATTTIEF